MSRFFLILAIVLFAVLLAIGSWYGVHYAQLVRANMLLDSANDHIVRSNELVAQAGLENIGLDGFTSVENIKRGAAAAGAALPLLDEARSEAEAAAANARRARGLLLLPDGYRDYFEKKEEIASLRVEQMVKLAQAARNLEDLYTSGPVIFNAVEEMDRLIGQFQTAIGKMPGDPEAAEAELKQTGQSMRQIQKQLDATNDAENSFQVLTELSEAAGENAELADLSADLARATASGDQAAAQQAANLVNNKLLETGEVSSYVNYWLEQIILPVLRDSESLQSRQEQIDAEAAEIYNRVIS